jgi:hypothetical protein
MVYSAHRIGYPDDTSVIGCLCGLSHRTSDQGNEEKAEQKEEMVMIEVLFSYDTRGYTHILYYYDEQVMLQALDFVQAVYDREAKVAETTDEDGDCNWYALIFWTENAFESFMKQGLVHVVEPDLYDFNNLGKEIFHDGTTKP